MTILYTNRYITNIYTTLSGWSFNMNLFYLGVDVKQDIDSDTKQEVAVDMKQEDVVTTAAFFMDITIPSSNNETKN